MSFQTISSINYATTYDLDPDSNFNAGSNICDYLIEEQFNEIIKSRINNRDNFSLLHLNIRSLQANLDRLTELLSCLSSQFSVIAIDRFHLTSRRPYWCTKTMKWRPYWCTVRELALSYSNISYCFTTPLGPATDHVSENDL